MKIPDKFIRTLVDQRLLIAFGLVAGSLYVLKRIPFINIYAKECMSIVIVIAAVIGVGLDQVRLYIAVLGMFVLLMFAVLGGETEMIEYLSTGIFLVLCIATGLSIKKLLSEQG